MEHLKFELQDVETFNYQFISSVRKFRKSLISKNQNNFLTGIVILSMAIQISLFFV